jgi:hypothetical protein
MTAREYLEPYTAMISLYSEWRGAEYFCDDVISPEAETEPFPLLITSLADLERGCCIENYML